MSAPFRSLCACIRSCVVVPGTIALESILTVTFCSILFGIQWAGKTIALGTFPAAEADEKCARAKALTRAWRSTMRPKPSRDWVMLELERLGVRVVSGRLGRKAGEEEEGEKKTSGTYDHHLMNSNR